MSIMARLGEIARVTRDRNAPVTVPEPVKEPKRNKPGEGLRAQAFKLIEQHPGISVHEMYRPLGLYKYDVESAEFKTKSAQLASALWNAITAAKKKTIRRVKQDGAWRYYPVNYKFSEATETKLADQPKSAEDAFSSDRILEFLDKHPGSTISELAEHMGTDKYNELTMAGIHNRLSVLSLRVENPVRKEETDGQVRYWPPTSPDRISGHSNGLAYEAFKLIQSKPGLSAREAYDILRPEVPKGSVNYEYDAGHLSTSLLRRTRTKYPSLTRRLEGRIYRYYPVAEQEVEPESEIVPEPIQSRVEWAEDYVLAHPGVSLREVYVALGGPDHADNPTEYDKVLSKLSTALSSATMKAKNRVIRRAKASDGRYRYWPIKEVAVVPEPQPTEIPVALPEPTPEPRPELVAVEDYQTLSTKTEQPTPEPRLDIEALAKDYFWDHDGMGLDERTTIKKFVQWTKER